MNQSACKINNAVFRANCRAAKANLRTRLLELRTHARKQLCGCLSQRGDKHPNTDLQIMLHVNVEVDIRNHT